jgi:fibronectin type 3 domain-containing protein/pimeloyl-ACP methyl ester carboxylesterase
VWAEDIDGDGDQDVLSASFDGDTVAWYENNGGTFSGRRVLTTNATSATSVFAADLTGDGDKDVLSASLGDDKIAWYENTGAGSFSDQRVISTGIESATSVYAAPLNEDERTDVLAAASESGEVVWFKNTGSGTFSGSTTITTDAETVQSVHAADLDGDGDQDVLSASFGDDTVAWYENDGTGSFSDQKVITTDAAAAHDVHAADLDGDGDRDVLSASFEDDTVAWYENDGTGSFSNRKIITTGAEEALSVFAADLTGNAALDVLSASRADNPIAWYENQDDGGPEAPTDLQATVGEGGIDLTWSPGGEGSPAGYNVYRSTSFFSDPIDETKLNTSPLSDASYTDTGVTSGTTYYYQVTAVDDEENESGPSNQTSATPSSGPFADWPDLEDPSITFKVVSSEVNVDRVQLEFEGVNNGVASAPVSSGFAKFPDPDPVFSGATKFTKIRLVDASDQIVGYLPFKYELSDFGSGIGIDAVIYVHDEDDLRPDLHSGRWSDKWNYYDVPDVENPYPLSMLVPPKGDIDEVDLGEKDPVVLVHGVSGRYPSWGNDIGKVRELTGHLDGEGYNGWQFYYPENQNITKSGPLLAKAIHRLQNNLGYGPDQSFDIVAHSMGGLVSRHYIQRMGIASSRSSYSQVLNFDPGEPGEDVGKFLMLGTPNHGSYSAYRCTGRDLLCKLLQNQFDKDVGAPAFRQMTPGSRLLSDLNRSDEASEPYSSTSTLALAGTRNPPFQSDWKITSEIPRQDDGVVAVSSAGLLDLSVPLATIDYTHSGAFDKDFDYDPRLNEDTQDIITNFLSEDYSPGSPDELGPITGFWGESVGGEPNPQSIYENDLSAVTDEGILTINAEGTSIQSVSVVSDCDPEGDEFRVACVRIGGESGMKRVPSQNRFFSHYEFPEAPSSLGFAAATGLPAKDSWLATVQKYWPGGLEGPLGEISLPTKYLHTTQARLEFNDTQKIAVEASGFTPSIGTSNSSENGSTSSSKSTVPEKAQTTEADFQVDTVTDTLAFWLARDSTGDVSGHNMRLTAPDGTVIDSSTAKSDPQFGYTQDLDVGYAIYRVEDPAAGRWRVRHDASVPMSVSAPVMSTVDLQANAPDSSFTTSETVPVTVSFSSQNTYEDKGITAQLRVENPEGGTTTLGAVGLDESGPTTYEGEFSPSYVGSYQISVDFSAQVGGEPVRRRTAETVEVTGDSTNTAPEPPPAPTSLSAQTEGTGGVSLSWSPSSESVDGYRIYRDTIPNPARQIASTSPEQTAYTDPGVQGGQTYYYRVTAMGAEGVESDFAKEVSIFTYPSSLSLDIQRSFGDPSGERGYRLVALPGAVDEPLSAVIGGEAGADWQAWWDDGSSQDYFQKYDGSDTFTFRGGRGFWVLKRSNWTVSRTVQPVPLSGEGQASIPLHEGWNIISNPFGGDLSWTQVDAANSDSLRALWRFDGSFAKANTFRSAKSGEAFYFLNDTGLDSLSVPYPSDPSARAKQKEESSLLTISARPEGSEGPTSTVKVGIGKKAAEGLDRLDQPAPPGQFSAVSLRLEAPGKTPKRQRLLMAERRPPNAGPGGGHTFDLRLRSQAKGPVQISANRLEAAEGSEVRLLHLSTGQSYDLREKAATIEETDSTSLRLAVGSAAYVQDQAEKVIPDEVTLTSYPNPMSGQATLEYTLPEAKEVRLTVYDVLGRQVAVLDEGRKEAGRHEARLDGSELSSGVYFGRLQIEGQTRTQKITVVR